MGVKQFSSRLTADQRGVLESVPSFGCDAESMIIADLWVADAMAAHGRAAAEQAGAEYPDALGAAVRQFLERSLRR